MTSRQILELMRLREASGIATIDTAELAAAFPGMSRQDAAHRLRMLKKSGRAALSEVVGHAYRWWLTDKGRLST